ncbi:MAG: hypothetical protein KGH60_03750 [Candidatus Micrarchaeota archaeon]|nr:hypothetical protein [Candidatus Micrarchaeota archaeon]
MSTKEVDASAEAHNNIISAQSAEAAAKELAAKYQPKLSAQFYESAITRYERALGIWKQSESRLLIVNNVPTTAQGIKDKIKENALAAGEQYLHQSNKLNINDDKYLIFETRVKAAENLIKGEDYNRAGEALRVGCQYGIHHAVEQLSITGMLDNTDDAIRNFKEVLLFNQKNPIPRNRQEIIDRVITVLNDHRKLLETTKTAIDDFLSCGVPYSDESSDKKKFLRTKDSGLITKMLLRVGDCVHIGDEVCSIEVPATAYSDPQVIKIRAQNEGIVKSLQARQGEIVTKETILAELE